MTRVSAIEGHSLWAPLYDLAPNPLLALERRTMRNLLESLRPAVMVDVACGTGQWLLHFQQLGSSVFGVDACEQMLNEARKNMSLHRRVVLGHAERLPFRESVSNLVLCSMALGYFHDLHRVFREFARVSAPGACIAVSDLHPNAIASGWTRSFKLGETRYKIDHYCHSLEKIGDAAATAGLRSMLYKTAHLDDPELSTFKRAGKEELLSTLRNTPALSVSLWEKPC